MRATLQTEHEMKAVVRRILQGQQEDFRVIIRNYRPLVIHIVYRLVRQSQDREDLCQDVFIKIYNNLHTFRFAAKLSTWIARIAYNTSINFLQKKGEVLLNDMNGSGDSSFEKVSDSPQPDEALITQDTGTMLEEALDRLSPVFRAVITLYHLENMSYEEIGKILSLPQGTVKSYLYRARQKLKTMLEPRLREERV